MAAARIEGEGIVTPDPVVVDIERAWILAIESDASRRQRRDDNRQDRWGRGYISNSHRVGMLAEMAVSYYLHGDCDTSFNEGGDDGGSDIRSIVPVDVKTTVKLDAPAVRGDKVDKSTIYIFTTITEEKFVTILGWLPGGEFRQRSTQVSLPSGTDNWQPEPNELRDISTLRRSSKVRNLLRYPGGKTTIISDVAGRMGFMPLMRPEWYVEPFVGGGSMLCHLSNRGMLNGSKIWINDLDRSLAFMYEAIRDNPDELIRRVIAVVPTPDAWFKCKELDGSIDDPVGAGVCKIFLHYCSAQGLGFMAGGPQGGKDQTSDYPIGCRWNPFDIARKIKTVSGWLQGARITNLSFEQMDLPQSSFVFADPPYVGAGQAHYRHAFDTNSHRVLSEWIRGARSWCLTYDDCELVRELYSDCHFESFEMGTGNNPSRKYDELVITPM